MDPPGLLLKLRECDRCSTIVAILARAMFEEYRQKFGETCLRSPDAIYDDDKRIYTLDGHQQAGMETVGSELVQGSDRFSIVHPGGSGKTVLETGILRASQSVKAEIGGELLDTQDVVWVIERSIVESIERHLLSAGLDVGVCGIGRHHPDRPVLVATIQSIQRGELNRIADPQRTTLIIGDEADRLVTEKRAELLKRFENAVKIGLTATPELFDGRSIESHWGPIAHRLSLRQAIEKEIVIPPLYYLFEADVLGDQIGFKHGDYEEESLEQAMKLIEIERAVPELYRKMIPRDKRHDFPTLIYVPTVSLLKQLTGSMHEAFSKEGVVVSGWHGDITNATLSREIRAFEDGDIDVLVLCEMGGRGLNLVRARYLIDASPTASLNKLEQRHSRVLRRVRPGTVLSKEKFKKPYALVVQIIPKANKFRPVTLLDILEAWEEYKTGELIGLRLDSERKESIPRMGVMNDDLERICEHVRSCGAVPHLRLLEKMDYLRTISLREDLPKADEKGFIYVKGIRYGTYTTWGTELELAPYTVRDKLKEADKEGIPGRNYNDEITTFYSESDVLEVCKSHISLPKADKDGFIVIEGQRFALASRWAQEFGVAAATVEVCLEPAVNVAISGRDRRGNVKENAFFHEEVVRRLCGRIISMAERIGDKRKLPLVEEDGFAYIEGEQYGSIEKIGSLFGLGIKTVSERVEGKEVKEANVIGKNGHVSTVYKVEEVIGLLSDILIYPQVGAGGFITVGEERCASATRWADLLRLSEREVLRRVEDGCRDHAVRVRGLGKKSGQAVVYPESKVRECCQDLIEQLAKLPEQAPKLDAGGFFIEQGCIYGTVHAFSKSFLISPATIRTRLKRNRTKKYTYRTAKRGTCQRDFYMEIDVSAACADLLNKSYKAADVSGFITDGEIRYATITQWAAQPNMPTASTIRKKLKKAGLLDAAISGKNSAGYLQENAFFPETSIKKALEENFPKASEDGFLYIDGKRYATLHRWWKTIRLTNNKIKSTLMRRVVREIKSVVGIPLGFDTPHDFYPEDAVIEIVGPYLYVADEEGFFKLEDKTIGLFWIQGEAYGTLEAWVNKITSANKLPSEKVREILQEKLSKAGACGIPGRDISGSVTVTGFYPRHIIFDVCPEFDSVNLRREFDPPAEEKPLTAHQKHQFKFYLDPDTREDPDKVESAQERLHALLQHKEEIAFRVKENSEKHPGLAGDTVYVISRKYSDVYDMLTRNSGLACEGDCVFAFTVHRSLTKISISELVKQDGVDL